jgi:Ca2+-binding EF-hand superfamily protein
MKTTVTILGCGLLLGIAAGAQLPGDSDGDGAVSLEEMQAWRARETAERFEALDADSDGRLTAEEFRDGRRQGPGRTLERFDSDGDGAVTLAEIQVVRPEASGEHFAELDVDGDGRLTEDEFRAMTRPGIGHRRGGHLAELDTDGDGALSLAELQVARPELTVEQFSRIDRNGDGLISDDERPAGRHGPGRFARRGF